jgi:hypothetical protein
MMPAFEITTSTRPNRSHTWATASSSALRSQTSAVEPTTWDDEMPAAISGVSGRRSTMPTWAPRERRVRAVALPSPAGDEYDLVGWG